MILNNRKPLSEAFANQRLISGESSAAEVLASISGQPGIILTNRHVLVHPELSPQVETLKEQGWSVLQICAGEPTIDEINRLARLTSFGSGSFIIAIGGGSVIDAAKSLRIALDAPDLFTELSSRRLVRVGPISNQILAIPTTLGSGSESSSSALLKDENGVKKILVGKSLIPEIAVLDARLIQSINTHSTAASILDGIAHAMEGFMSKIDNPIMNLVALNALNVFLCSWKNAIDFDPIAIEQVQIAGNLAGQVQDKCLVGPAHVLAHHYNNFPHGYGVGLFLMPLLRFYQQNQIVEVRDRFEKLIKQSGSSFEQISTMLGQLLELAKTSEYERLIAPTENEITLMQADPAGMASPVPINEDLITYLVQESAK